MTESVEIVKLRRQQTAIANFGSFALHQSDLQKVLDEAARVCADGLGTDYSKICRYRSEQNDLLIEAGYGWRVGLIGNVVSKADASSPQGRAFTTGDPAICTDIRADTGFVLPSFYTEYGIISTIDVLIQGSQKAYGVLEVDSDREVNFDTQDIIYLTGFANVLAEALASAEQRAREAEFALKEKVLKAKAVESQIVAETALRTANARTSFITVISHELRTPLNAIIGFSELLSKTSLDAEQKVFVSVLQDNATHLRSLVNDILEYARIETGKVKLDKAPFAIRELISAVTMTTVALVGGRPIQIKSDIDLEVSSVFSGDVTRIRQVLLNLLGNAVKFTASGSISICVSEKSKSQDSCVIRFEVRDTGIGVDPAIQTKIFELYEGVDGNQTNSDLNSGVGLAVSRAIVNLMGGAIGVVSELGKGSNFWFEIPLQIAQPVFESLLPAEPESVLKLARQLKILVADDSKSSRLLLEVMLMKLGHKVTSSTNGFEAVSIAGQERFDLIILDLQMPIMDGLAAAHLIRAMDERVGSKLIFALSADARLETETKALEAGMDKVLHKPLIQSELIRLLQQL